MSINKSAKAFINNGDDRKLAFGRAKYMFKKHPSMVPSGVVLSQLFDVSEVIVSSCPIDARLMSGALCMIGIV